MMRMLIPTLCAFVVVLMCHSVRGSVEDVYSRWSTAVSICDWSLRVSQNKTVGGEVDQNGGK